MVPLNVFQQMAEIQVICVHQGVYCHEIGNCQIAIVFIYLVIFALIGCTDCETVFRKHAGLFLVNAELPQVINIAQIRVRLIGLYGRGYINSVIFQNRLDQAWSAV